MSGNKIKVLQITPNKYPGSPRILKEGKTFKEAGFDSAIIAPLFDSQIEFEELDGIKIFRPKVLYNRSILDRLLLSTMFYSPAWNRALKGVIREFQPDALHVHDIWLGRTVLWSKNNEKIILDLHENIPAAVLEYQKMFNWRQQIFFSVFQSAKRMLNYEGDLLEKSDLVFTVVEEAQRRVVEDHPNLDKNKVLNIMNLESKAFLSSSRKVEPAFEKDHFSILYIGGFGPHRGIDTLIKSMSLVKKNINSIKIQLVGAKPSHYLNQLKRLIVQLGVQKEVEITSWVDSDQVLANILQADLCCVPHNSNPHTDNTIPHKLFQYMIAKRPILVSSSTPLKRIINDSKAGLTFKAGDANDCAEKILLMAKDKNKLKDYAQNGYNYVTKAGHNWEKESALNLVSAYQGLFKK